ncbi:MAG: hypothetical protein A2806_00820 [Candidatus Terrybacteria bacterium RIFCSPHIGHO2_01_FULL_48_17]|uniref:Glycosyltransferase 2-like domain-containing protein n=1 Tax=Candidatus Terrybacteria bacterium RIFCSPHIGHO2_01_FULL_48_17 TaxID=1802362 RepID=A0A1G2PIK6_9BACT|nr:MAG: hypothetical protein A2806_00820 [Candidatus Terrybacteria bacterium RIFCSPHIGHO2_01_FULL_48_17]OHA53879.1 MAG: hypothetical protein A3A30_01420 [Candidatus Terrybacteria bacterium RIFCSPLOWO2_01_FULL_48_14]
MEKPTKTTIIVLNWNGWKDTLRCLESLLVVKEPVFEVLVVDNGSEDESVTKIQEFIDKNKDLYPVPYTLIANKENLGFAGGNNIGIKIAYHKGAGYVLLLNNDTIVDPGFLKQMLDVMEKHHTIGLANPKIYRMKDNGEKTNQFWFAGADINWLYTRGKHRFVNEMDSGQLNGHEYVETGYATGGCLLIRRQILEEIHLMPEDYFLYYEDAEWSLRAKKAGWLCAVIPAAKVWHKGAASTPERSVKYVRYHVRGGLFLCLRNAPFGKIILAYLWSVPRAAWHAVKWLFLPEKRPFAAGVMLGIRDAWLHKVGEIKE